MKHSLLIFLLLIVIKPCHAQNASQIVSEKTGNISFSPLPVTGLWVIEKVEVNDKDLTPTAKWILLEEDGTFTSGNGWLQNDLGSWIYDDQQKTLLQSTEARIDPYGPFNVSFQNEKMIWERIEEGNKVSITLVNVNQKPMAPWDTLVGTWEIRIANGIHPTTGRVVAEYLLERITYSFNWDRRYNKFDTEGVLVETGIWQIDSHSPILTLISDDKDIRTRWAIEFSNGNMLWERLLVKNELMKLYFKKG
ncbi:hypothetical protein [Roseivirga echinicomitans]|uniref:Lipocalin-like domain-containing protein n=1 Tax=Roseivirga echinicomitans TaxID=296218 RepID=A0A150XD92_9BACT|nr:hypothetical protein [Roseivirga echinicomitans]KYG76695.1 hypothetical protein AWN68_06620 [Roseivirga echinicomitans]